MQMQHKTKELEKAAQKNRELGKENKTLYEQLKKVRKFFITG